MATLTIKNIPDEIYQKLKQQALLHRRSLNKEVIISLEQALRKKLASPDTIIAKARKLRSKTSKFRLTEKILNAAKNKGRP
jgi:plasmid stability protein